MSIELKGQDRPKLIVANDQYLFQKRHRKINNIYIKVTCEEKLLTL
jgi:hypothetical protein